MALKLNIFIPILLLASILFVFFTTQTKAEIYSNSCNISTSTAVSISLYGSTNILATSSNRAWAMIELLPSATNTVFLNFAGGATAVANKGIALGTTTSNINSITFGRNADMPYVGAVTGIPSVATSSVLVTECLY